MALVPLQTQPPQLALDAVIEVSAQISRHSARRQPDVTEIFGLVLDVIAVLVSLSARLDAAEARVHADNSVGGSGNTS
jgi:hypothetical protein